MRALVATRGGLTNSVRSMSKRFLNARPRACSSTCFFRCPGSPSEYKGLETTLHRQLHVGGRSIKLFYGAAGWTCACGASRAAAFRSGRSATGWSTRHVEQAEPQPFTPHGPPPPSPRSPSPKFLRAAPDAFTPEHCLQTTSPRPKASSPAFAVTCARTKHGWLDVTPLKP